MHFINRNKILCKSHNLNFVFSSIVALSQFEIEHSPIFTHATHFWAQIIGYIVVLKGEYSTVFTSARKTKR